ncbi:HNH endonuclease signature motif containing protein, partial [Mycobacterium sp. 852002-10029_SCH5224772]|uniref:HNH endonuclease signature motif containing protein n=1 Tax=Mycobacterium sp. 852002-10029_SCH5224772 TaxID=1834083 RepID=UPI000ABD24CB
LLAGLRGLLASGKLGQHNGLPACIIVTTTLAELEAAAGRGLTGGGTIVPMTDVIRLGRHAHHYLAIFDNGKALALYHTKRLASPGQRIVLHAKDRGCTTPGCTVSGYYCEVHHVTDYATCHSTDINDLTFACGPHHRMLQPRGWTTRKDAKGDTEWIPPPHLDRGQPRTNTFHHPEKLLRDGDDDDEAD